MSYMVMIVSTATPSDDEAAWDYANDLACPAGEDGTTPSPRLLECYQAITAKYPDGAPAAVADSDPWCGNQVARDAALLTVAATRADEVVPFIERTALAHGCTFFDPQQQRIARCA